MATFTITATQVGSAQTLHYVLEPDQDLEYFLKGFGVIVIDADQKNSSPRS